MVILLKCEGYDGVELMAVCSSMAEAKRLIREDVARIRKRETPLASRLAYHTLENPPQDVDLLQGQLFTGTWFDHRGKEEKKKQ